MVAVISFSQIEVKEVSKEIIVGAIKNGGKTRSQLSYSVGGNDTTYTIMYQDIKYHYATDLDKIHFSSKFNNLENLYQVLRGFFSKENKKNKDYKLDLTLGENKLLLSNYAVMGITTVMVTSDSGSFALSEKQLDKLFGK